MPGWLCYSKKLSRMMFIIYFTNCGVCDMICEEIKKERRGVRL